MESATPGSAFSDRVNEQLPPALTTRQDFALIVADEDGVEPGDLELAGNLRDRDINSSSNSSSGSNGGVSSELGDGGLQSMSVSGGGNGRSRNEGAYATLEDTSEHHK